MTYKSSIRSQRGSYSISERVSDKWNYHGILSLRSRSSMRDSSVASTSRVGVVAKQQWRVKRLERKQNMGRRQAGRKLTQFAGKVPRNTTTVASHAALARGDVWTVLYNRMTMNCGIGAKTHYLWHLGGEKLVTRVLKHVVGTVMGTSCFNYCRSDTVKRTRAIFDLWPIVIL